MDYNYLYILAGVGFVSYFLPRFCFYIVDDKKDKDKSKDVSVRDKGFRRYVTIMCFIFLSLASLLIYSNKKQFNLEQERCTNANGIYVFSGNVEKFCIEKNAYHEYKATVNKAYEKYMEGKIDVK